MEHSVIIVIIIFIFFINLKVKMCDPKVYEPQSEPTSVQWQPEKAVRASRPLMRPSALSSGKLFPRSCMRASSMPRHVVVHALTNDANTLPDRCEHHLSGLNGSNSITRFPDNSRLITCPTKGSGLKKTERVASPRTRSRISRTDCLHHVRSQVRICVKSLPRLCPRKHAKRLHSHP